MCKRCITSLKDGKRARHAHHFPPADVRLTSLNKLEMRLISPAVTFMNISRVYSNDDDTNQYVSFGAALHFFNEAGDVAERLPRAANEASILHVKCSRNIGSDVNLRSTVVEVRPERVRNVLLDLIETSAAYHDIEFDEEAMSHITSSSAKDTMVNDDSVPANNEDATYRCDHNNTHAEEVSNNNSSDGSDGDDSDDDSAASLHAGDLGDGGGDDVDILMLNAGAVYTRCINITILYVDIICMI